MKKFIVLFLTLAVFALLIAAAQLLTDKTPPELFVPEEPYIASCNVTSSIMDGITALDGNKDVSSQVIIENKRAIEQNTANYIIYVVSDEHGNVAKKQRPIKYYQSDEDIEITKKSDIVIEAEAYTQDTFDLTEFFEAKNTCGIDVSEDLYYDGSIDFTKAGTYQIQIRLQDNDRVNLSSTITITEKGKQEELNTPQPDAPNPEDKEPEDEQNQSVEEEEEQPVVVPSKPVIVFRQNPVHLMAGSTFQFMSHIETIQDNIDSYSLLSRRVRVTNLPNTFVEGEYVVTYMVTNTSGLTGVGELTVIIDPAEEAEETEEMENPEHP